MRIGIDLGGTKIEAIAMEETGQVLGRKRILTPRGDYPATLAAIRGLVEQLESMTGQPGTVGIGIPGAISPVSRLVKNANSTWLIGQPLLQDLQATLGRHVRIANDANCFALSEATDGAAASATVVFGVIIGTGTGGSIAIHSRPLVGANAICGEWGHNPLPWPQPTEIPGPDCYCGKQGCLETWLSGPGLRRDHRANGGTDMTPQEIVAQSEQGDHLAEATLQRYEDRLARGLATVINLVDPDVIVLGGGLANLKRLYTNVPLAWGQYIFSDHVATRLVAPMHGDASGVRGAAWLWNENGLD
jgi:fructokinase